MERALGLMAGAGALPGRAAAEARRQGWRVVAFAFGEAPGLAESAERVVPARLTDLNAVLEALASERVQAALFVGKFWKHEALAKTPEADPAGRRLARDGFADAALAQAVVATLGNLGIEVLDQRPFLGPWVPGVGVMTSRAPSESEWQEIRSGFKLARSLAGQGIGQTVVRALGVTVAVEALEGTDETIRRGTRLAGAGAVVVKAVAQGHDYRFDVPAIGAATLHALAEGRATALAVEGGRVLVVDPEHVIRLADRSGIAVVSVDDRA